MGRRWPDWPPEDNPVRRRSSGVRRRRTVTLDPADPQLLDRVIAIARAAGEVIMPFFRRDTLVRTKADHSPVTAADEAADALITNALRDLTPEIPVVSEESAAQFGGRAPASTFWLVDPLDGTREFIAGRDEFTVNIALVEQGSPILGVVLLPARGELYAGARGAGAALHTAAGRRALHCRPLPAAGATVAVSRSHGDRDADLALLGGVRVAGFVAAGSALKFGLIAAGDADLYPRSGRTMEWDTAAGQAVVEAAGGAVFAGDVPLVYGKQGFINPAFLASGRQT
jgi:3'(2'), 5'-bisphosphate nucleotidase